MSMGAHRRVGRIGPAMAIIVAFLVALPAQLAFPGVALAEGEVPADVTYASIPQNGVGNQYSAPYQWWKVALQTGDVLDASLAVTSEAGDDVYLWLYLPGTTHYTQNSQVASGYPGHPIKHTATQTGDYLFCVYSFDAYGTSYTITWSRTPAPTATTVTLTLKGLTNGAITRGQSVTAKGSVTSATPGPTSVRLTVQRWNGSGWLKVRSVSRVLTDSATYSWRYTPSARGSYRIRASVAATPTSAADLSPWRTFRVKAAT